MKLLYLSALLLLIGCSNQNDDNTVYVVGRSFSFNVHYIKKDGNIQKTDSLSLLVTDEAFPQSKQTSIRYKHFQLKSDTIKLVEEHTGVEDSETSFWLHPPRKGDLHILSFATFPSISRTCIQDSLAAVTSNGTIGMAKMHKGTLINTVKTKQEYKGKTTIELPFKTKFRAHQTFASAESELGIIYGTYYFDEVLGFVKLDYLLPDSSKIVFELKNTNFKQLK